MFDNLGKNTLGPLVLRLALAAMFLYHGLGKINAETAWGSQWDSRATDPLILATQVAVSWGEVIFGGVFLLFGFCTRPAAIGGMFIQLVAMDIVSFHRAFAMPNNGGWQLNFCLAAACLALFFIGGGTLSLDNVLLRRKAPPQEVIDQQIELELAGVVR